MAKYFCQMWETECGHSMHDEGIWSYGCSNFGVQGNGILSQEARKLLVLSCQVVKYQHVVQMGGEWRFIRCCILRICLGGKGLLSWEFMQK